MVGRSSALARKLRRGRPAMMMPETERLTSIWTPVDGRSVHARVSIGSAAVAGPPVVLVHGFVVSSRYMLPTAERLAPTHRVYAPDLPGWGKSARPPRALTVPQLADALAAWMAAVGLDRGALVGNSFGCQIVADLAARHPERVERAVLLGPTVDPSARSAIGQTLRWLDNARREPPSLGLIIARDLAAMGLLRAVRTLRYMLRDRIEAKLPLVRAPTLVVRGSRDSIAPQRWAEEAARLLPRGRLVVIPGVPHTLNYNRPREVVRVLRPFLARAEIVS